MPSNAAVSAVRSTSVNSIQHSISAPFREKHTWTIPPRVREGVRFAAVEGEIIRMIGGNGNSAAECMEQNFPAMGLYRIACGLQYLQSLVELL